MDGATMTFSRRHAYWHVLGLVVVFGVMLSACSRSAWMKSDGHEVSPNEQLACAEEVRKAPENRILNHEEIQPKIDDCMKAKGYHRRPWWLLNDLHWNISPPS